MSNATPFNESPSMTTATIPATVSSLRVKLTDVVRFRTVNTHIPCAESAKVTIVQNGEEVRGYPVYKGAVWFQDGEGRNFVSFVNKSTALWKAVRHDRNEDNHNVGGSFVISANVKELREADEHGPLRFVVTHVKLG